MEPFWANYPSLVGERTEGIVDGQFLISPRGYEALKEACADAMRVCAAESQGYDLIDAAQHLSRLPTGTPTWVILWAKLYNAHSLVCFSRTIVQAY